MRRITSNAQSLSDLSIPLSQKGEYGLISEAPIFFVHWREKPGRQNLECNVAKQCLIDCLALMKILSEGQFFKQLTTRGFLIPIGNYIDRCFFGTGRI